MLLPVVSLALATGMRRGELLGLQWGDIDLDAGTLRVERSVEETKAGLRLKPPKTKRGRRNITLPSEAVAMLRAHKVRQMEIRLALGMGNIKPDTLVFGTIEGELVQAPQSQQGVGTRTDRLEAAGGELPRLPAHARFDVAPGRRGRADREPPPWPRQREHHAERLRPPDRGRRRGSGEGDRRGAEMKVKQALTAATSFCREAYRWVSRGIA